MFAGPEQLAVGVDIVDFPWTVTVADLSVKQPQVALIVSGYDWNVAGFLAIGISKVQTKVVDLPAGNSCCPVQSNEFVSVNEFLS